MRRYCLAYDAKDAEDWDPDELRVKIAELLIAAGALNLKSPVASTILFEDEHASSRMAYWNSKINHALRDDIYYYLCLVAITTTNAFIDRNEGDTGLEIHFQELIDEL